VTKKKNTRGARHLRERLLAPRRSQPPIRKTCFTLIGSFRWRGARHFGRSLSIRS